ncbi:MAG: hypothetical protein K5664_01525 [Firmicutes bacterium]|nr:hypothetical protein [Bacillota bacterium]
MNIIVHLPTNEEKANELRKAVANLHSEKIINVFQKSHLQKSDMEKIIDLAIKNPG